MGDFERAIGEHLRARADDVGVPPHLGERIETRVTVRRRRRRLAEISSAVATVAVVIAVPVAVQLRVEQPHSPRLAASTTRPPRLNLTVDHLVSIPRELPGGKVFSALALGPDGTLIGQGTSFDRMSHDDGRLWRSGPAGGTPRQVTSAPGLWAAHTDGKRIIWPQNTDRLHDFQLMCAEADAAPRQLGRQGVAAVEYAFAADSGIVVWNDEVNDMSHTVWAARSCDETPQPLFHGGSGVAFSYPDVLVAGEKKRGGFDGRLTQVDVDSGAAVPLHLTGPSGLAGREDAAFAANRQVLAWADGGAVTVLDRRTGAAKAIPMRLPHTTGVNGEVRRLTAGNKVLVYSTQPQDGDPDTAKSLVYDLRTAKSFRLAGDAYAAGDWFAWRDGASYRLGRVR
jgi:hypothetical protein